MPRRRLVVAVATALALPLLGLTATATQSTAAPPAAPAAAAPDPKPGPASDVREPTPADLKDLTLDGKQVTVPAQFQQRRNATALEAGVTPPVGTVRQWLGLDDFQGRLYRKDYTLRAVGQKIEVWVANDTAFPAGDCRTQIPNTTTVTDAQAQAFVEEFDNTMYPQETATFSTPPDRDGSNAILGPDANGNGGDYSGGGDKTVALIDNVRDDNFYDFPAASTYIAGFFSSQFNELFDRNVMTIDAFDWAHRTGTNPPDEPTADVCTSRPARPRLYEGTFAHEWQHLLHYYTDPFETTWMNEGLSDFAQTLTGYVDGTRTVFDRGADSHLYCFQGFGSVQTPFNPNPRDCGGPENSLNLWGEGVPAHVLADYGNAYSLMLYLYDHYGVDMMCTAAPGRRPAGPAEPGGSAQRRGCDQPVPGAARLPDLDAGGQDRRWRERQVPGQAEVRGDDAEPALHGELRQPGRERRPGCRPERRGLRPAAEGGWTGADAVVTSGRCRSAVPPPCRPCRCCGRS